MNIEKDFLDFLYEQRAAVQADIDRLVKALKEPIEEGSNKNRILEAELRTRRSQIMGINHTIEKYINSHAIFTTRVEA